MKTRLHTRSYTRPVARRLILLALLVGALAPNFARAASSDDDAKTPDARLEGFGRGKDIVNVSLGEGSTTFLWIVVIFLMIIGISGLFKNAKRTHLD